jgi:hypothetical protein
MFTKNIKDSFTANLLNAVSGVLGEAKKCKDCGCAKCTCDTEDEPEETKEGYMPTNDMPSAKDRKTAGKLGDLLKRERDAKEKKEPNGVKTEEVEEIEEKRGLWDNIHAKRKRIKAGSGERMRKPGSEGAPSAADLKASQKESVDPGLEDELMSQRQGESGKKWRVERHGKTISTHSSKDEADVKAMKHPSNKVVAKESIDVSFEQIDEISKPTLGRYINKAKNSIDLTAWRQGYKEAGAGNPSKQLEKKLSKRHKGIETAVNKLTKEDAEQIDELSKGTMGRYINKAATKMGSQGVTAGLKIAADEKSSKNFKDMGKREKGIKLAVSKLTKEEQDFIDALNADTLDEGMDNDMPKGLEDRAPRGRARNAMGRAIARKERNLARARKEMNKEETEITEARGRPKKAGARDFTIHPKTKEKLMHDNPAHMKKIEALQKTGMLQKPKTEASQHIMNQLSKAKTSMRGGETINFTHGDPTHVSGTHAAKLLDRYAGMKPNEKEAFQKKIGHSHAKLKSEL